MRARCSPQKVPVLAGGSKGAAGHTHRGRIRGNRGHQGPGPGRKSRALRIPGSRSAAGWPEAAQRPRRGPALARETCQGIHEPECAKHLSLAHSAELLLDIIRPAGLEVSRAHAGRSRLQAPARPDVKKGQKVKPGATAFFLKEIQSFDMKIIINGKSKQYSTHWELNTAAR